MAMTIDWPNALISVPQSDLTLVSGTIYRMNTETYFRTELMKLMDDEQGIVWPTPFEHNTEVTIAGVTYARTINLPTLPAAGSIDAGPLGFPANFQVQFTPDSQWTVILEGSNNNIFDVENGILVQNQVQVIPTNSAGLQVVTTGSGLDAGQDAKLTAIHGEVTNIESGQGLAYWVRVAIAALAGKLAGAAGLTVTIRDQADTKNRITATVDQDGNRTSVTVDGS